MNPIRVLRRAPFYSAAIAACFAIGIAALSVTYTFARAVLLEPVPLPEPERLVTILSRPDLTSGQVFLTSYESFAVIDAQLGGSMPLAAVEAPGSSGGYAMPADVGSQPVNAARATGGLFEVTQARFLAGRAFSANEAAVEAPVAVVTDAFADRHFGGAAAAIGASLMLNRTAHQVIGVIPAAQALPIPTDVILPMDAARYAPTNNHVGSLVLVARLPDGMTAEALDQPLAAAAARLAELYPTASTRDAGYLAAPLRDTVVSGLDRSLTAAIVAVLLLLLVTLMNAGGLVTVRTGQRRQAFAVRSALGASSGSLIRTLVGEVAVPAALGAAGGVLAAWFALPLLLQSIPVALPNADSIRIDVGVVGVATAAAMIMTLVLSLFGALRVAQPASAGALREGGRSGLTRGLKHALSGLVVAQVGAAVFLVAGSMLLVESFGKVVDADKGFEPAGVMTLRATLPDSASATHASRVQFIERAVAVVAETPGVVSAGVVTDLPVGNSARVYRFSVDGQPLDDPDAYHRAAYRLVTPGYIETLDIDLIEGRLPTAADRADSQPVVVVGRHLAERFWPGQSAIGQRIKKGGYSADEPWLTVVGVVDDVRDQFGATGPSLRAPIGLSIYLPIDQYENDRAYSVTVVARAAGDPALLAPVLRASLAALSSEVVLTDSSTLADIVLGSLARERLLLWLFTFFAGAAILLAAFGIYAVVTYVTQLQNRETGIRLALGSTRGEVARGYLLQGVVVAAAGCVAGIGAGLAALPRLEGLLFEMSAWNPAVFAASAALAVAVVLIATLGPALRASRVNPVQMLRAE